jgi:YD repeat-containing protein
LEALEPVMRLSLEEHNDGRFFLYDQVCNLIERTDRDGRAIEYEWDHLQRMVEARWKEDKETVRTLTFSFEAAGALRGFLHSG